MELSPEEPQPLKKHLRLFNDHLEVHQVALEAVVLGNPHKLPGVELVAFLRLYSSVGGEIDSCHYLSIEHDLCLAAYRCLIIPLLKDESAEDLDTVSVGDIDPAGRWYGHCVVSKVDEQVDVLPIIEAILTFLRSE